LPATINICEQQISKMQCHRRQFLDVDGHYFAIYVLSNTLPSQKLFDKKAELNGTIEACLKTMDLSKEMKEPKCDVMVF